MVAAACGVKLWPRDSVIPGQYNALPDVGRFSVDQSITTILLRK